MTQNATTLFHVHVSIEKENLMQQMRLVEKTKQEEIQHVESKVKNCESRIHRLQTELEEQNLELLAHRKYVKQTAKLFNELERQYGPFAKLEYDRVLNSLMKKQHDARKKFKSWAHVDKECAVAEHSVDVILNDKDKLEKPEQDIQKRNNQMSYKI